MMNKINEASELLKKHANFNNVDDFVTIKTILENYDKALDILALYMTTTSECPDVRSECYGGDGCLDLKKCRNCWKEWALNVER